MMLLLHILVLLNGVQLRAWIANFDVTDVVVVHCWLVSIIYSILKMLKGVLVLVHVEVAYHGD